MKNRISNYNITELASNEVFVFGSNESGRHGKGAAKTAMKWGAKYGQAEGLQGKTYGIPTVNSKITDSLSISKIKRYIDTFIQFAKNNSELTFLVTEIGCGLAGHSKFDIAPLFKDAMDVENIHLPETFWLILKTN
jgi:hypothetical protein